MVNKPIRGAGAPAGQGAAGRSPGPALAGRRFSADRVLAVTGRFWALQLLLFCLGAFVLFFPILGRTFASDDFEVMRRVGMGDFRTPGFFRPLSDLSLYVNYLLGAFGPAGYYAFNILVHGVNSWLVCLFCRKWIWAGKQSRQDSYALLAGLLFLCYPFHNEGIAWILGRGASLSTLFGLATLVVLVNDGSRGRRAIWGGVFYFIGMMAYEPVILLPLMCYILLWVREARRKEMIRWGVALGVALLLHLALRVVFSGGVLGQYERNFFGSGWRQYAGNVGKVTARLLLPPTDHTGVLLAGALVLLGVFAVALVVFFRRTGRDRLRAGVGRGEQHDWIDRLDRMDRRRQRRYLGALFLLWCVSVIVPVVSAVSTRTSESDRLLYFPSVFVCCILSYLLVLLVSDGRWVAVSSVLLLFYMICFLEKNNSNWVRASDITRDILTVAARQPAGAKIFVIDLPDERDGAYIFRLGFPQALLMEGRDTAGLVVVSHLKREQWLAEPDSIVVGRVGGAAPGTEVTGAAGIELRISPGTRIRRWGVDSVEIENDGHSWLAGKGDRVLYWDKKGLRELALP